MEYFTKDDIKRNVESAKRSIKTIQSSVFSSKEVESSSYSFKWGRKGVHLLFSIFGFVLAIKPHFASMVINLIFLLTTLMILLDTMRLFSKEMNHFIYKYFKQIFILRDTKRYSSATFYMIGILVVTLIFEPRIAGFGIIILGIGDLSASLGGSFLRKYIPYKLPFLNKTYIGLLSFIFATSFCALILGFDAKPALIAIFFSALSEAYITFIDDNLLLPLVGSSVYYIASIMLNGPTWT